MGNKINIAELLKDCPSGMELDCTCADNVVFDKIIEYEQIKCVIGECRDPLILDKYGRLLHICCPKCVIFPKGKTTWEGFIPPCKFKAGDVIVSENGNIVLFSYIDAENIVHYHCIIPTYGSFRIEENTSIGVGRYYDCVLANEQQRQRMYDKIKCSGYKYNQSTNTLEKLVKPKFKVGDKIVQKDGVCVPILITKVGDEFYYLNTESSVGVLPISKQDDWELTQNKFDINTLVTFESKVLCRDNNTEKWKSNFWGFYDIDNAMNYPYECCGNSFAQCIPYEGNEHLLGKTDDCAEFYKTWK